ncbi:MAG TPA: GNAT family N-acetyltransferase [Ktedonobacterales bacterium]|nr:GNAT family N-acetyltransferase [Ktedonobacterales bacterium]
MARPRVTIRPFNVGDQDAAKRLVNEGLGERFGLVDESFNPDLDDIAAHYSSPGHTFVVAEQDDELIGTGCLVFAPKGTTGQMVRVSVRRDLRGQGVGHALVEHLLNVARAAGLRRVWMETNVGWESAIRLYKACGFREYDRVGRLVFLERKIEAQSHTENTEARDAGMD